MNRHNVQIDVKKILEYNHAARNDDMKLRLLDFEKELSELPPVTPQPKTGHWIADVDRWGDIVTTTDGYRCSECNGFNTDKDNYCPNCGAKMEVDE